GGTTNEEAPTHLDQRPASAVVGLLLVPVGGDRRIPRVGREVARPLDRGHGCRRRQGAGRVRAGEAEGGPARGRLLRPVRVEAGRADRLVLDFGRIVQVPRGQRQVGGPALDLQGNLDPALYLDGATRAPAPGQGLRGEDEQ